ncbi:MAG: carbohydrate binding family 9 domain-containing protein, partial [Gemmatimonadota bacterium]
MTAVLLTTPPVLDGDVLNDSAWQSIQPESSFWQKEPDEGEPASERTEVRVAYTEDMLYVAAVLFDREPENIIVSDSRRDASLDNTDSFRFILDTYQDNQNGFVFGTNPAGIEYDAQVTNAGQGMRGGGGFGGGRQRGGSGAGFNINWDGAWEVYTTMTDSGWSVEFAIPFRTLRFPQSDVQSWGINFQRTIRRRKENSFWAQLPRQFDLNRVSLAGEITGLRVPD